MPTLSFTDNSIDILTNNSSVLPFNYNYEQGTIFVTYLCYLVEIALKIPLQIKYLIISFIIFKIVFYLWYFEFSYLNWCI